MLWGKCAESGVAAGDGRERLPDPHLSIIHLLAVPIAWLQIRLMSKCPLESADASRRLDRMVSDLSNPTEASAATLDLQAPPDVTRVAPPGWSYERIVERGKEEIRAGETFEVAHRPRD